MHIIVCEAHISTDGRLALLLELGQLLALTPVIRLLLVEFDPEELRFLRHPPVPTHDIMHHLHLHSEGRTHYHGICARCKWAGTGCRESREGGERGSRERSPNSQR